MSQAQPYQNLIIDVSKTGALQSAKYISIKSIQYSNTYMLKRFIHIQTPKKSGYRYSYVKYYYALHFFN